MKSSESSIMDHDNNSKYGEKLEYDPEFKGPVKHRSCTDILCLFLFVAFLAGWAVVAIFAFREGNPRILLYPTDSDGNICGVGKLQNKSFLFFFDLLKCARPNVLLTGCPTPQVCVSQCPTETFLAQDSSSNDIKKKLICKYDVKPEEKDLKTLLNDDLCGQMYFKSTALLNRCIPEVFFKSNATGPILDEHGDAVHNDITVEAVTNATRKLAQFLSLTQVGEKIFSDLKSSWQYIIGFLVIAMIISLVWIILMRWLSGPMVWLSLILVLGFSAYACYYSTTRYIGMKDTPGADDEFRFTLNLKSYLALRKTWLAFAIISGLIFAILFLIFISLRKRIYIAIALIKEASRAVGCVWSALFFPLLTYALMIIFIAFWLVVALYIASSGKASFVVVDASDNSEHKNGTTCNPKDYNSTGEGIKCMFHTYGLHNNIYTSHAYNLFGLFWALFFVVGIGQLSLAGAFSTYYWTLKKSQVSKFVMCTGFYRCIRFHLGSVAFASLLIATVRFIRVMIEYVDAKLKKYDNKVAKFILWCMRCCFWCLEKILRFINKNAYIMIAIYGKGFCHSAKNAFFLLMRNIVRVIVLDKLTDFLLLMGKLVVVACSAGVSYYFFATEQTVVKNMPHLNYAYLPIIIIAVGAYMISSGFFSVYGMAVDTLFLCFLEDCERNDGSSEKPYYMSKELMKILHKKNKFRDLHPDNN